MIQEKIKSTEKVKIKKYDSKCIRYKYFYNFKFYYSEFVYFPRYETENIIFLFEQYLQKDKNIVKVLDVGTGTGCIGITLKKLYPYLQIELCDINKFAIEHSLLNVTKHSLDINVYYKDFFKIENINTDVIVCNPPYICSEKVSKKENKFIQKSKDGGVNGTVFILKLMKKCTNVKYVILEIGSEQQFVKLCENTVMKKWKCIKFLKPYNNAIVCFCIFQNLQIPTTGLEPAQQKLADFKSAVSTIPPSG